MTSKERFETMTQIDELIDDLIGREGGYANHPADRGGPTHWGITEAVARRQGYVGEMRALPRCDAAAIYKRLYWLKPRFDAVAAHAPALAAELFDTGVNMGTGTATAFLAKRGAGGERVLLKAVEALQGAHYINIAEARPSQEAFVYGWLANRVGSATIPGLRPSREGGG